MDGTLKQNAEALKAEGEEMLKSQAVGIVQSKVQQISQSLEDQEGTRLQMLSSVSSVSPGVTTALEQLQAHREQRVRGKADVRAEALGALAPALLAVERLDARLARAQRRLLQQHLVQRVHQTAPRLRRLPVARLRADPETAAHNCIAAPCLILPHKVC